MQDRGNGRSVEGLGRFLAPRTRSPATGPDLRRFMEPRKRAAPGELCEFGDLGAFGVILAGRSAGELEILCQPLSPLDSGLVATLRAYLGHNGHVENAAVELDVHRHTMRNRLARIGALIGADLHSADTRAELWLAIKARELLALRDR